MGLFESKSSTEEDMEVDDDDFNEEGIGRSVAYTGDEEEEEYDEDDNLEDYEDEAEEIDLDEEEDEEGEQEAVEGEPSVPLKIDDNAAYKEEEAAEA